MNPSLRLLIIFFFVLIAVSGPLDAQAPVEFQIEAPAIHAIIDDPDPTNRLRLRPRVLEIEHVLLLGATGAPSEGAAPIVAWARKSDTGFDVVIHRYERGIFGPPMIVADSPADELDPRLTQDPTDGTVHLVYWIDGDDPVVVHRFAPADLSRFSEPAVISAPGERAARPAACVHGGVLYVAYESLGPTADASPRLIVLAKQGASGFTSEVVAATTAALSASPQVHSDRGRMWIEWVDEAGMLAWRAVATDGARGVIGREPFFAPQDRDLARGRISLRARE